MKLFLLTITILAIAILGITIKIWGKKNGKFSGTCASQSPFLNKDGENCSFCGKSPIEMKECKETSHQ